MLVVEGCGALLAEQY